MEYKRTIAEAIEFTNEVGVEKVWDLYVMEGRKGLSTYLGVPYNSIGHYLKKVGFYERGKKQEKLYKRRDRRSSIYNVFTEESDRKYYLLGFILGDGSIREKRENYYTLNISSSDEEHLITIAELFNTVIGKPRKGNWTIDFHDNEICKDLMELGVAIRKSYEPSCLKEIPSRYLFSFFRGLLDADGCIGYHNKGKHLHVEICGHPSYIAYLYWVLSSLQYPVKYRVLPNNTLSFISLYQQSMVKLFLEKVYSGSTIQLDRKYQRYINHEFRI